jgi:hypothetical protein
VSPVAGRLVRRPAARRRSLSCGGRSAYVPALARRGRVVMCGSCPPARLDWVTCTRRCRSLWPPQKPGAMSVSQPARTRSTGFAVAAHRPRSRVCRTQRSSSAGRACNTSPDPIARRGCSPPSPCRRWSRTCWRWWTDGSGRPGARGRRVRRPARGGAARYGGDLQPTGAAAATRRCGSRCRPSRGAVHWSASRSSPSGVRAKPSEERSTCRSRTCSRTSRPLSRTAVQERRQGRCCTAGRCWSSREMPRVSRHAPSE